MNSLRQRLSLIGIPLLLGVVCATLWVWATGGRTLLRGMLGASPAAILGLIAITAWWLFVRFLRWQFLLRRVGVRVPIRPSLHVYLAALPGTATPAYLGEAVRAVFMHRRFQVPARITLPVLVLERVYDVAALTVVGVLAVRGMNAWLIGLGILMGCLLLAAGTVRIGARMARNPETFSAMRAPATIAGSLLLSLLAWGGAALLYTVSASGLGVSLPVLEGARIYATATIGGAATLLPAGVGVTGSIAILEITGWGVTAASAVTIVSIARLFSTGLALTVGGVFLWREVTAKPAAVAGDAAAHFDEIAAQYAAQWSPHVWDMLLRRKTDLLADALPKPPSEAGLGLDLGCGLGLQCEEMGRRGYRVVGVDPSSGLLRHGPSRGLALVAGSALVLPFRDASLDFVYAIGVLHHLPGRNEQQQAYAEISRVLRPGGLLLVHESNPRNPFFRLYMGYVFPLLKRIDEGTEWWIPAEQPLAPASLARERVHYFTFLPDFTPRFLLGPAMALEGWLERGPTRRYSAHYLAVLRRST
ncbi:MAG TPA: lysylphosphatidylglycerol synthase domain-containing protein [Gemmatimonadaceae bacterium]